MVDDVVGVIGLGNMGRGIACNVARSRFSLIAWDIDSEKRQIFKRMKGVTVAPPKDMAKFCNAIFFLVPASPQISGMYRRTRRNLRKRSARIGPGRLDRLGSASDAAVGTRGQKEKYRVHRCWDQRRPKARG